MENELRDHSQPCEHGEAYIDRNGTWHCGKTKWYGFACLYRCPGGRKIETDPDNPPKAWTDWAEQGVLEWRYFLKGWLGVSDGE